MTSAGYLRFPHIHGDLVTFVAEDDVWLAPQDGGRAWRLSADSAQVAQPRFARDGSSVAWASWRDGPAEVYLAGVDGRAGPPPHLLGRAGCHGGRLDPGG